MSFGNAQRIDGNSYRTEQTIPVTKENLSAYLTEQGLNWQVKMVQEIHPLTHEPLPYFATMRDSDQRIFTTGLSSRYVPLQHTDAFENIADMATLGDGMTIARAASFDGGRVVFAQTDLGEMHIGSGLKGGSADAVKRRLTFATAHDGSAALTVSITPVRIVCRNTLTAAVSKHADDRMSLRHTQSGEDRLKTLAQVYKVIDGKLRRTEATFQALAGKKIGRGDFAQVLESLFPTVGKEKDEQKRMNEQKNDIAVLFANADDGKSERDTAWNLYNAYTRQTNHFSSVRATDGDFGKVSKEEARDRSALFGTIAEKNAAALKTVTKVLELDSDIDRILASIEMPKARSAAQAAAPGVSQIDAILNMMDI